MKKTISVLLALVLTVGLFSACSKDGKEETTTAAPAAYTLAYTYDSHYAQTDPSAVRAYEKIAKAIAEGGVAVRVNTDMMDDVNRLLYTGFPLMALVDTVSVNNDNSGVTIKYKNDTDTHRWLVGAFSQKVNAILKACGKGTVSNHVYLLNVYHYVATHTTYNDSVTDTYTAILQGKGMSAAISGMFEFLLQQGGVDAGHIVGKDAAGNPWYFTRCTLGDTVYNFDVATELSVRKGEGLTCFAMTDKELQTGGLQKGFTYSDNEKAPAVKMKKNPYAALRSCAYFTLEGNTLTAVLYSGKTATFTL